MIRFLLVGGGFVLATAVLSAVWELWAYERAERRLERAEAERQRDHDAALRALLAEHHLYVPETEDHA